MKNVLTIFVRPFSFRLSRAFVIAISEMSVPWISHEGYVEAALNSYFFDWTLLMDTINFHVLKDPWNIEPGQLESWTAWTILKKWSYYAFSQFTCNANIIRMWTFTICKVLETYPDFEEMKIPHPSSLHRSRFRSRRPALSARPLPTSRSYRSKKFSHWGGHFSWI